MPYINAIASDTTLQTDIKTLIPDPIVRRRMSRIVKRAVSVGMECVQMVGNDAIDAIITATGFGCLDDSEKFLNNVIENDEQLLNPTPFIQSTFNTVGGQIGLLCKNHCYNMTYTHRGRSFESALLDAVLLLDAGEAHNVLLGAFDETTPTQHKIMERMGLWRRAHAGEGAYFFVLSDRRGENCVATIDVPEFLPTSLAEHDLRQQYGNALIYNDYDACGVFHTAAAAVLFEALGRLSADVPALTLYNSYFGTMPTMLHIRAC